MIVYHCCLILVQLQSNVHFEMTVEDFLLLWTIEFLTPTTLHANFLLTDHPQDDVRVYVIHKCRDRLGEPDCLAGIIMLLAPCSNRLGHITCRYLWPVVCFNSSLHVRSMYNSIITPLHVCIVMYN